MRKRFSDRRRRLDGVRPRDIAMKLTGLPSIRSGPTRRASAMQVWNILRLTAPASSMRISTLVSRLSNTRGGAK